MTKTEFYSKFNLVPDSGNTITSWGAIQRRSGKYLLQCWDVEKKYIKKEDRTDDAVVIVKVLSPKDLLATTGGGPARCRSIEVIKKDCSVGFIAVSTGTYPDWIHSANINQVYPVLSLYEKNGEVFARAGEPLPIENVFHE